MDDNTPNDSASAADSARPRRAPPTIDLAASEVTPPGAGKAGRAKWSFASFRWPSMAAMAPLLAAAVTGALAAGLVIAGISAFRWLGDTAQPMAQAESNASAIAGLSSRLAALEGRFPQAPADSALPGRFDALEKSFFLLRSELTKESARADKLAAELEAAKAVSSSPTASPDLVAIEERLSQIERTTRGQGDGSAQSVNGPADDIALRRLVVASMLDISVRQGEPFAATLAAAKALAGEPEALKPLEDFARSGLPNPASLTRELLNLVPKLSPPAEETSTIGTGVVDRLKASASKLVRIERTDVTGSDRGAIVGRITAAALRNDLADARREMEQLSPPDREVAQGWLDKVKERDAALAAAHHFANEAMAVFAKPAP
jgi:hypothetical protein